MTDAVVITPVEHPSSLDAVGDAIAVLAARLHAATYELLVLLRRFDAAAGWNTGFVSCAHWLSWRTGMRYREIQVRFSRDEGVVVNGKAAATVPADVLALLPPVAVERTVPEGRYFIASRLRERFDGRAAREEVQLGLIAADRLSSPQP